MTVAEFLESRPARTRTGFARSLAVTALACVASLSLNAQESTEGGMLEWPVYGGSNLSQHYSPLAQINAQNVDQLRIAWRWSGRNFGPRPEVRSETTPLMIDGVLYATAGVTRNVVAIDAQTGQTLWIWRPDEGERFEASPRKMSGRGVAWWRDGDDARIFVVTPGFTLAALDADSGQPVRQFGESGFVDMHRFLRGPEKADITSTSPAMVVGDVVVVGPAHGVGARPDSKERTKGDVRGFDARTGELLWTFRTIPEPGEDGAETWLEGSGAFTGNAGVWAPMAADSELGLVYLPVEAPTSDFYGGERPGNNLYGNSLVAVDVRTGERVWHQQLIHHDIWDYDNPTAPILLDVVVDGEPVRAIVQLTKQAMAYAFDRVSGEPLWPIEERPVPGSDVPGEWTSPTQPFPTKPAPYDRIGVSEDDLIDFTPEIKAAALEAIEGFRLGSMYTPPSLTDAADGTRGTLMLPNYTGGTNWEGGAADPQTGYLFVGSRTVPAVGAVRPDPEFTDIRYVFAGGQVPEPLDLPLIKPPYGRITAIDMNTGEHVWMVPNGGTPERIANHPALAGLDLPPTGKPARPMLMATSTLLFAGEGFGGDPVLRALDKATGATVAEIELPGSTTGLPMTYLIDGKQYIVVAVEGDGQAELVALTLP